MKHSDAAGIKEAGRDCFQSSLNRIPILPQEFRTQAGIDDQVTFVGIGKLFQIWSPARLASFQAATRDGAS